MKIDLLYFDGCPSWKMAWANLRTAIQAENLEVMIQLVEVTSDQEAVEHRFLGSPSFQIDGADLWPEDRKNYAMSCRVYRASEGLKGWPTVEMLRQKLRETLRLTQTLA